MLSASVLKAAIPSVDPMTGSITKFISTFFINMIIDRNRLGLFKVT